MSYEFLSSWNKVLNKKKIIKYNPQDSNAMTGCGNDRICRSSQRGCRDFNNLQDCFTCHPSQKLHSIASFRCTDQSDENLIRERHKHIFAALRPRQLLPFHPDKSVHRSLWCCRWQPFALVKRYILRQHPLAEQPFRSLGKYGPGY